MRADSLAVCNTDARHENMDTIFAFAFAILVFFLIDRNNRKKSDIHFAKIHNSVPQSAILDLSTAISHINLFCCNSFFIIPASKPINFHDIHAT